MHRNTRNRRITREQTRPRVLIVCEGKKTEPFYLDDLREFYNISRDSVEI